MLTAAKSNEYERKMRMDEIIEECKNFYYAGQGTTSILLTWTTMLLSLHQGWQEKLREEVFNECGKDKIPDTDTFSKLKLVMFIFIVLLAGEEKGFLTPINLADEHGVDGVASSVRTRD
jgi:cytochrome P450